MNRIIVIISFVLSSMAAFAQLRSDSAHKLLARYDRVLSDLKLDTLHGKITALYTPGYRVRARTVHAILKDCSVWYDGQFPGVVFNPQVVLLDSSGWATVVQAIPNSLPYYGLPDAEPAVNKIFIAAEKKAVARLVGLEDNLPDSVLSSFDYISLHELGHIFLQTYEHTRTNKKWADEFLASYFALCYLKQVNDSLGLPQIDETGYQPEHRSLADFEKMYEDVGPANYGWYQGKFQKLATELYPKFRIKLLKLFIANFPDTGSKMDPLVFLQQVSPDITNRWLAGL